jgi:predicted nucleotidyltransferase
MTSGSSAQRASNEAELTDTPIRPDGLSEGTVAEIRACLQRFPQLGWVKLYGSRAMGRHRRGSDIDLAFSSPQDCSAALLAALDELPTPYRFDVTHWESLHHAPLQAHIERVGVPFP